MVNNNVLKVANGAKLICGIVAVMLVLGSCGDKDKYDDKGNGGKNGILTITGIPAEYNGKYVDVDGGSNDSYLVGFEKMDGKVQHFVKISGGEAKVPMWKMTGILKFSPYTGNDKVMDFSIDIYDIPSWDWGKNPVHFSEGVVITRWIKDINFTNGNATAEWGPQVVFAGGWEYIMLKDGKPTGERQYLRLDKDGKWLLGWGPVGHPGFTSRFEGTYTSNGNIATMTITRDTTSGVNNEEGRIITGTMSGNKLNLKGFKYDYYNSIEFTKVP